MDVFTEEDLQHLIDDAVPDDETDKPITYRHVLSAIILALGLVLGVVGNTLFYAQSTGLNLPIFVGVFIAVTVGLVVYFDKPRSAKHLLFFVPAMLFAVLAIMMNSHTLFMLNFLTMMFSLVAGTRFLATQTFLGGNWRVMFSELAEATFAAWLKAPLDTIAQSSRVLRRFRLDGEQSRQVGAVVRGIGLTLPILWIFMELFSAADVAFGAALGDFVAWFTPRSFSNIVVQIFIILWFAALAITGLRNALFAVDLSYERDEKRKPRLSVSLIETGMILSSVNALFAVFILFQWHYLFGGEANITAQGFTYAVYARRGFEELLIASGLTIVLIMTLDHLTLRDRERDRVFRGLATFMIALTGLLLVAALYRLYLYENAYGYTTYRVMGGVFMLWLAVLLGFLVHDILRQGTRRFWTGCVLVGFGFVLTLNVMNMDAFIARQNVARWERGESLDYRYLTRLSNDALPVLIDLVDDDDLDDAMRDWLTVTLEMRLRDLETRRTHDLREWNPGRERAYALLSTHFAETYEDER